jgi:hypothetical protein
VETFMVCSVPIKSQQVEVSRESSLQWISHYHFSENLSIRLRNKVPPKTKCSLGKSLDESGRCWHLPALPTTLARLLLGSQASRREQRPYARGNLAPHIWLNRGISASYYFFAPLLAEAGSCKRLLPCLYCSAPICDPYVAS